MYAGLTDEQRHRVVGVYEYLAAGAPPISDYPAACFVPGGRFSMKAKYSVAGVRFDPQIGGGIGSISDVDNIHYMGFLCWMTPTTFLNVNPPRRNVPDFFDNVIDEGFPLSPPYMRFDVVSGDVEDSSDRAPLVLETMGHEGRGRMTAMSKIAPAALMPVYCIVRGGYRSRHLDPDKLLGARVLPDNRGALCGFRINRITIQNTNYSLPGLGEPPCVL